MRIRRSPAAAIVAGFVLAASGTAFLTGCEKGSKVFEGAKKLEVLYQGMAAEFRTEGIYLNLVNDEVLIVTFRDTPFNGGTPEERSRTARRAAEYVRDHYPSYDALEEVRVVYASHRQVGLVQVRQSDAPLRFTRSELGPASPAPPVPAPEPKPGRAPWNRPAGGAPSD